MNSRELCEHYGVEVSSLTDTQLDEMINDLSERSARIGLPIGSALLGLRNMQHHFRAHCDESIRKALESAGCKREDAA